MNYLRFAILGFQAVGELFTNLVSLPIIGDLLAFDWLDIPASFVLALWGNGGSDD